MKKISKLLLVTSLVILGALGLRGLAPVSQSQRSEPAVKRDWLAAIIRPTDFAKPAEPAITRVRNYVALARVAQGMYALSLPVEAPAPTSKAYQVMFASGKTEEIFFQVKTPSEVHPFRGTPDPPSTPGYAGSQAATVQYFLCTERKVQENIVGIPELGYSRKRRA